MKFSVTIPAYKAQFLAECIDSILAQTYKDFELIIVNDHSPQDLDSIINKYHDPRIRYYVNEKNCGALNVVDNWNKCLDYAQGDYVICMGDDDKLLPNCLEEYAKLIAKYPGIGLLHGWTEIIGEDSVPYELTTHRCEYESAISLCWHRWNAYSLQFIGDFCFNREWLIQHGGFFKLPLAWASDDISAIIGALKNGVANTQDIVFQYRRNRQTISSTGNIEGKMHAKQLEEDWYRQFLAKDADSHIDQLYLDALRKKFQRHFEKAKALTISGDIKSKGISRVFYWYRKRKRYNINMKMMVYAVMQSFK